MIGTRVLVHGPTTFEEALDSAPAS